MRTAVITGTSGGIGTAIALAFAGEGCNVVLQYNKGKDKAEALAEKIQKEYGVIALPVQADISSSQSVKSFFDEVEAKLSNVDVLVNNAGIAQQKLFTDITDEDWHRMIGTNLDGVFYYSREVLNRFMIKNHSGVILNISSMWGQAGASCEVHYSAAKAGVIGLTKALAKEVGLITRRSSVQIRLPQPLRNGLTTKVLPFFFLCSIFVFLHISPEFPSDDLIFRDIILIYNLNMI